MQPTARRRDEVDSAMRVRQNVAPAAIGALLLLYFGFLHLAEPTGTDVFGRASWVFYHTLRLGGLAMGVVALWCVLGQSVALVVDAVITVLIGVLLILTGLAMAVDGGDMIQTIINVVCGGMFISSGVRNWRDYRFLGATLASTRTKIPAPPFPLPKEGRGEGQRQRESMTPVVPPPEGFLASLAKKKPPPNDDEGPSK